MGGCKCSYRNCTAKSNGQIHLFHYPVFDKPRCHKWLVNGHRQDFLNLKVSQLKNRVVCQYHFRDEDFMNIHKEKLKPSAVPTLNGPYCDPDECGGDDVVDKFDQLDFEDIENDLYLNYDKKHCFSHKYGNFLANNDIVDLDLSTNTKPKSSKDCVVWKSNIPKKDELVCIITNPGSSVKKRPVSVDLACYPKKQTTYPSCKTPRASRVEIISDEKVDGTVLPDPAALEPVKYDAVLPLPNRLTNSKTIKNELDTTSEILLKEVDLQKKGPSEFMLNNVNGMSNQLNENNTEKTCTPKEETDKTYEVSVQTLKNLPVISLVPNDQWNSSKIIINNIEKIDDDKLPKVDDIDDEIKITAKRPTPYKPASKRIVMPKNKLCSKRLSTIQQKRDFNKKLTDIISSQLSKEKGTLPYVHVNRQNNNNSGCAELTTNNCKTNQLTNSVKSHLSKDRSLLSENQYSIAVLELRMNKMEQMLLQKMEHNSRMVLNLQQALDVKVATKKTQATQTAQEEENHKRYLYNEISKFLTPEANNLIYEELFINKHQPKRLRLRR